MVGTKRSRNKINNAAGGNKSVKKLVKKGEIGNSPKSDGRPSSSYKKTHNIGNRRATNLPNSYKESDVAVLFDKNYFSNFRCSMTFGRGGSKEKSKQGSAKASENPDHVVESRLKSPCPSTSTLDPGFSGQTKNSTTIGSCKVPVNKTPKASKRSLEHGEGSSIPNKRARRTASLNAGAILAAMLEKKSPATKKPKNNVDDRRLSLTANFNTVAQSLSSPRSSIKSQTDLISSSKHKKTDSSKNKSLNKSFVDMSCSPINVEDELRRQNFSTPSELAGNSKRAAGDRNKTPEKRSGQKVEKTKRILFRAHDFPCIDLTRSSEENSEHLAGVETQKTQKSGSGTKSGSPAIHKPTRSPTLSSSSSATILNVDSNACGESSSKSDSNKDSKRGTAKKRSERRKGHEASGNVDATSKEFPIKTNRRLASLNAKAVLAACLDTPRRHQKTRKFPEKETPVHEGANSSLDNSNAGKSNGLECSGNDPHLSNKKQNFKKQPGAALAKNSSLDGQSGIVAESVLPARNLPKRPDGQNSASTSGNTSKPSKSLEKKQTTGTSPLKVVASSVPSTTRSVGSYHLMPSPITSTGTGRSTVSQQSSIYEQMCQTPRQFSSGRPPTSAVLATILPHQLCLPRPTATAFQGYPASGVAGPVTSLLLPRQHFPTQSPDAGLFSFPYQNLSLLQCSGSGTSRPSVHGSFSAHQQISSPSYLAPPTATVLFGSPQPHINLQLCPPMAYGQVCRQFSPTAPSYYQTVPFPSERFQFCNSSSSPPLSLSGSSSHIFIPYSNSNRSMSTMMNLTSPPSMTPSTDAQNALQSKKRPGKGRVSGGPESVFTTLGMMHSPTLTLPMCASGKSSHYNQYVRISPKKTEQTASTSNSSVQTASSVLPQPSLLSGSSSEIPRILKFTEDVVPIRISASPDPIDSGNCRLPETKVPPVSQECPVGKVKAKKRARTGEQKTDSIPSKRVHESKPTSDNVPKHDIVKPIPSSKTHATKGKKTASLKSETGKTGDGSVILDTSVDKVQTVVQNGNPSSADRGPVPVPIGKIFDQVKVVCQDAKINCSPVVVMGIPLEVDGSKICTVKSLAKLAPSKKKGRSSVASPRLISKNKSPNKKMGNLLFLKSRSPSRAFMKGSPKKNAKSGKKNIKISGRKSQDEKSSSLRNNGLNKKKCGGELSASCPKLDLSSKNGSEKASSWSWLGTSVVKPVSVQGDGTVVRRTCYPAIRHAAGDIVRVKDCVFVRSGTRKRDIPYIAKIYGLWEEGETKEMMMGVFWYYRREHIDSETVASRYLDDEVFASRHRDIVPVACIEDKCFVLPFNQYCRYRAEVSRLECGGGKSLSSRIVPPLLEASDLLSLSVTGTNSSSSCNKTHITPSRGSTMSCTSSSVACSPSANEVVQVSKEPGRAFADKCSVNILDDILSTGSSDSKMSYNAITNNAEGSCLPARRDNVQEKTESELSDGSLPAKTMASPTAAVEEAVEAVKETEARSTDEAIAMEVDDKALVVNEIAATPTSEVDEAMTTLTSVVAEVMEMAASVATPISAVEEAMDTEVLVMQNVDEEAMELTAPTDDEVDNQLAAGTNFPAIQASADELKAVSETLADELKAVTETSADELKAVSETLADEPKAVSETSADELKAVSETLADELKAVCETSADELKAVSEASADELKAVSETLADELKAVSETSADDLNAVSEASADKAISPPTMQIDESTNLPTTKSDAVTTQAVEVMQASEAEGVVTSSAKALAIDALPAAAIHEDTITDPPSVDDGVTIAPIDLPTTAAGEVTTALATEATETNTASIGASDEVMASPTTAADVVVTTGTAAVKDTDEPVTAPNEVDPEILLEMAPTSTPDDNISASANPELGSTPKDGTATLVDETHTSDLKSSTEVITVVAGVVKSPINHSSEVIATRSVEADEIIEVGTANNHTKEEAVTMPELVVTSVTRVPTPCQSPKVDNSSSTNNDKVLPMEICQESATDVSRTKSLHEDLCSNPGIGSELPLDIGSLKALCSKVLNLSSLNLQPDSSNSVHQTCPMSSASGTITVFSTPTITSSEVLISTLSKEMKVDQMATKIPTVHCVPRLSELSSSSISSLPMVVPLPRLAEVDTVALNLTGSLPSETTPLVVKENRAIPDLPLSTVTTLTSSSMPKSSVPIPPDSEGTPFVNVGGQSTAPRLFSLTEHLAREVDRDNVFLCRHIYDIKLRRISKNPNIALHAVQTSSSHNGIPSSGSNSGSR